MKSYKLISILILAITLLASCGTQNMFTMQENKTDNSLLYSNATDGFVYRLKPDDKLSISIWNHDDLSMGSIFGIYNSNEVYGKWQIINHEGLLNLPKIGTVKLSGLTIQQAEIYLQELYAEHIVDPIIVIKVLNLQVTVLGEVKHPDNHLLDEDYNSLTDVLGMAGGLDFYADMSQIKLIRESSDSTNSYIIDLTSMDKYDQSNIRILPGDIIYVPVRRSKNMEKRSSTIVAFAGLISAIAIVYSVFN